MENSVRKKVLIIRLTSLGDVIFTLPLANALKEKGCEVSLLVAEKGLDIVKNNPCVDKVFFVPLKKWRKNPFSISKIVEFWKLVKELRKENFDIALDVQQMFKSMFLFWFCGAKRRITFSDARELSVFAGNEFVKPMAKFTDSTYHIVERNLDFARYLGIESPDIKFSLPPVSQKSKEKVDELLKNTRKPMIVIAPATTWQNKHWSEKNWKDLIFDLKNRADLVFTGMDCDKSLISRIGGDKFLNLAGKTNVEELREVLSRANVVISPDSGTAHLAWASGKPAVIALFTCTPPLRFGPYDRTGGKYYTLSSKLPCQPCFKKKCKKKNMECCSALKESEVIEIIDKLINSKFFI